MMKYILNYLLRICIYLIRNTIPHHQTNQFILNVKRFFLRTKNQPISRVLSYNGIVTLLSYFLFTQDKSQIDILQILLNEYDQKIQFYYPLSVALLIFVSFCTGIFQFYETFIAEFANYFILQYLLKRFDRNLYPWEIAAVETVTYFIATLIYKMEVVHYKQLLKKLTWKTIKETIWTMILFAISIKVNSENIDEVISKVYAEYEKVMQGMRYR